MRAPYTPKIVEQSKPKGLWERIKEFLFGASKYRKIGGTKCNASTVVKRQGI